MIVIDLWRALPPLIVLLILLYLLGGEDRQ